MNQADYEMGRIIDRITNFGFIDKNPRPKYKDGSPAHTCSVNHTFRSYDITDGEIPILNLRPIAWKTAIREMLAIYQNQSNKISEFERYGCGWWNDWSLSNGTIGRAYPYNLESHRPNEMERSVIQVQRRIISKEFGEPYVDDIPMFKQYDSIDGTIYLNRYKIIGIDEKRSNDKYTYCKIQFVSNNYITSMRKDLIGISEGMNPYDRTVHGIGYLGDYKHVNNFTDEEITILKRKWESMFFRCYTKQKKHVYRTYDDIFVHHRWHSFETFLRDVRMLPQYFLAKEEGFKDWDIDKDYYGSNCYSLDTCVFLKHRENVLYATTNSLYEIIDEYGDIHYEINLSEFARKINTSQQNVYKAMINNRPFQGFRINRIHQDDRYVYRYELSRNQVIELMKDIKNNPYGRRHIISFWNWANIDKKALVECAYETIWNVRNEPDGSEYLDMVLVQRSGDLLMASGPGCVNEVQYSALLMMIARHCGYLPGVFSHVVANEQIYDRHVDQANQLLERIHILADREREYFKETEEELPNPRLILNPDKKDFYDITIEDFVLENYDPIKPQLTLEIGI